MLNLSYRYNSMLARISIKVNESSLLTIIPIWIIIYYHYIYIITSLQTGIWYNRQVDLAQLMSSYLNDHYGHGDMAIDSVARCAILVPFYPFLNSQLFWLPPPRSESTVFTNYSRRGIKDMESWDWWVHIWVKWIQQRKFEFELTQPISFPA